MDWPENGAPANFDDIVTPLIRAFNDGATWRPKISTRESDINWTGLPLESSSRGPIGVRLSADWRANDRGQGRTFLETILGIAVNLGMEQGRRIELDRQKTQRDLLRFSIRELRYVLAEWENDKSEIEERFQDIERSIRDAEIAIAKRKSMGGRITPDGQATGA